jgi:hypothetical protein
LDTYGWKPEGADCLLFWYDGMEGSRFDGGRAKVYFDFTPKSPLEGEVLVTIDSHAQAIINKHFENVELPDWFVSR